MNLKVHTDCWGKPNCVLEMRSKSSKKKKSILTAKDQSSVHFIVPSALEQNTSFASDSLMHSLSPSGLNYFFRTRDNYLLSQLHENPAFLIAEGGI